MSDRYSKPDDVYAAGRVQMRGDTSLTASGDTMTWTIATDRGTDRYIVQGNGMYETGTMTLRYIDGAGKEREETVAVVKGRTQPLGPDIKTITQMVVRTAGAAVVNAGNLAVLLNDQDAIRKPKPAFNSSVSEISKRKRGRVR